MVFIGGWGTRRPRQYYPYGRRGYGYGNSSCMRDLCLVESGCCLAESLGCGPQLTLLAPSLARRSFRTARLADAAPGAGVSGRLVIGLTAAIRLYQQEISAKRRRPCCRYSPSCSTYAMQALEEHGLRAGLLLAARRLLRCRPGAVGGSDPVPPARG
jgi:uncharacterized protein